MYFASDEYQPEEYTRNISTFERGSAICTNTAWVPCTDCTCVDEGEPSDIRIGAFPADRCARDPSHPELTFVLQNLCDGTPWQLAAVNYGALMWVLIAVFALGFYLKSQEVQFDLDEQTAQVSCAKALCNMFDIIVTLIHRCHDALNRITASRSQIPLQTPRTLTNGTSSSKTI